MTERDDVHRRVFAYDMAPDVETLVRKRLSQRLDGFRCELQAVYAPNYESSAGTRIAMQSPMSVGVRDEIASANAYGLSSTETAGAVMEATGSNPHPSARGRPFCLDDVDGVDDVEGGAM